MKKAANLNEEENRAWAGVKQTTPQQAERLSLLCRLAAGYPTPTPKNKPAS